MATISHSTIHNARVISSVSYVFGPTRLKDTRHAFPLVPHFEQQGIRRRVFRDYLIFYRVDPQVVVIIHILHGARDYERLLSSEE